MQSEAEATIALMGATGTGKSSFINLLTGDDSIHVGHTINSTTLDVDTSIYNNDAGICVTLVDTPGFDDSREGVSDTDILEKITNFLQDDGGRKLNGIIYLYRISNPRFSGTAKKNLRVFRELCGDDKLDHVRIVTTFWNAVDAKKGQDYEEALDAGVFRPFLEAGAKLIRHDNGLESAKKIILDLARQPPVTMKIQEELNAGTALGNTSAGAVIVEGMKELEKKHAKEMEELKKELEKATDENNANLRAELNAERRNLAERIAQVEYDRKRLSIPRMPLVTQPPQDTASVSSTAVHTTCQIVHGRADTHQMPVTTKIQEELMSAGAVIAGETMTRSSHGTEGASIRTAAQGESETHAYSQKDKGPDSEYSQDTKNAGSVTAAIYTTPHGEADTHPQKGKGPDSEQGVAPSSGQEDAIERIAAMYAETVASLEETVEKMGENNRAFSHEREELQREIARLEAKTAELEKVISQLDHGRDAFEDVTVDEVDKATIERALKEEQRSSYIGKAMRLAEKFPLFLELVITGPILGGIRGFASSLEGSSATDHSQR